MRREGETIEDELPTYCDMIDEYVGEHGGDPFGEMGEGEVSTLVLVFDGDKFTVREER